MTKTNKIILKCHNKTNSREHMTCPACDSAVSSILLTGAGLYNGSKGVARRRKCRACGQVWRTMEFKLDTLEKLGV